MSVTRVSLDGEWKLSWAEYGGREAPLPRREAGIAAVVPGDVHLDLMRDGILPELFHGTNLDQAWWIETKDWWYSREFETPPGLAGRGAILVFHGLDTFADVWLNGELIGRAENMFVSHEWNVTGRLRRQGSNELKVRLASVKHSVKVDPSHRPLVWSPERLFCRKAQMSFGWDIAPRLMTTGIWRPVELLVVDGGRIAGAGIETLEADAARARVRVRVDVNWAGEEGARGEITGSLDGSAWEMPVEFKPGLRTYCREIAVEGAPLWFPLGYGDPALRRLEVSLRLDGKELDRRVRRVGLRRIELVQEPQKSGKRSFRFRVNGAPVFVTGLNWTPLDAVFARVTPERITRTLETVAGAGCNMFRVWGGGIYEDEHFFNECDRLGIMVWQDFMMACGWYPQTDEFAAKLEAEAGQVVRRIRHHPSLALWSGDNENDAFYPTLVKENRLTREVLARVCADLDPATPYVPSSPYSPSGADPQSQDEGDMHMYIHGRGYRDPAMWDLRPRFMSEFGHLSLPSLALIEEYLPEDGRWPLTGPLWRYHAADTIRHGAFRGADKILDSLAAVGRPAPRNLKEAVRASQELQAEAVTAWIERFCEDSEFGGFLLWNVADCWPQQSDSVLEYGGGPKLVFGKLGELFGRMRRKHDES